MSCGLTTVFSLKGGVGKTAFSIALSLELEKKGLDVPVLSNDRVSIVEDVLGERGMVLEENQDFPSQLKKNDDFILDLGGFLDDRVVNVVKKSKNVVIPTLSDYGSLQATITTVNDIKRLNDNVTIILNRIDKNEFLGIYEVIRDSCGAFQVFPLKNSKAFENAQNKKKSISQMMEDEPIRRKQYAEVQKQLDSIYSHLVKK